MYILRTISVFIFSAIMYSCTIQQAAVEDVSTGLYEEGGMSYLDKEMTVPLSDLDNPFQLHEREFISKYNATKYKLYDFKFIPSDDNQEELELS